MAVLNNQRVMENKKCLKPPTSSWMMFQLPDGGVHKWGYPFIADGLVHGKSING